MRLVIGILIALIFPATWILERSALLDVQGIAWNPLWTVFVFGFVWPFSLFLLFLAWRRYPIICLTDNTLFLRHVTLPWKTAKLSTNEVDWVVADWEPDSSHCCLKIKVSPSCFDRERVVSPWLRGEAGFLTMQLNNAEKTPDEVAAALNFLMSQSEKTTA